LISSASSGGSNVARVLKEAGTVGIDVHVIAKQEERVAMRSPHSLTEMDDAGRGGAATSS
jgi:hypothetical protein